MNNNKLNTCNYNNGIQNTYYYSGPTSSYNFYNKGDIGIGSASNSMKSPYISYDASTRSIGRGKCVNGNYVDYIMNK